MKIGRLKITPFFRWYDLWRGFYIDVPNRRLYWCPVPMFGLRFELIQRDSK